MFEGMKCENSLWMWVTRMAMMNSWKQRLEFSPSTLNEKSSKEFFIFQNLISVFSEDFLIKKKLNLWQSQEFILEIDLVLQLCLSKSSHIILFSREYCLKNVYATRMAKNHVHSYSCINLIRLWEHFPFSSTKDPFNPPAMWKTTNLFMYVKKTPIKSLFHIDI